MNKDTPSPCSADDIKVQGRGGLGHCWRASTACGMGNYISDYDKFIAEKLAHVMCGGDLSQASLVSEQYCWTWSGKHS